MAVAIHLSNRLYAGVECPERLIRSRRTPAQNLCLLSTYHTMAYYVYILRDQFGNLYIGQSSILVVREYQHVHKTSKAAKYIKDNGNFKLVYTEEYPTLLDAMRREKQLKGWTKAKKEALLAGNLELLKKLSKRKLK